MSALFCCLHWRTRAMVALVLALVKASGPALASAQVLPTPESGTASLLTLTPFQQKALLAFSPSALVFSRVTLNGTVKRTVGSTNSTGSVELTSGRDGFVSERWNVTGANRTVSKTAFADGRDCSMSINGGTAKSADGLECVRQVPWFAPWMAVPMLQAAIGNATESAGEAGTTVLTFAPAVQVPAKLKAKEKAELSRVLQAGATQILYESATALPSGIHYLQPLSTETSNAIDVSVVFSDYRLEKGLMVPHRIQRYVQRTLESDIRITTVVLN